MTTTNEIASVADDVTGSRSSSTRTRETHVEYEPQIERLLADTDERIGLCLDVGHHAYRGGDPVAFIRQHHERIPYLHLKSVDRDVQAARRGGGDPVRRGCRDRHVRRAVRGRGRLLALRDAAATRSATRASAIVEQDMYPAPFDKPFPIAKRTHDYSAGDRSRVSSTGGRRHLSGLRSRRSRDGGVLDDAGLRSGSPPR